MGTAWDRDELERRGFVEWYRSTIEKMCGVLFDGLIAAGDEKDGAEALARFRRGLAVARKTHERLEKELAC